MVWLGLDDTDSIDGGCTTHLFQLLLKRIGIGFADPRLVRLWPFAEERTRGNAAVAARLECTMGEAIPIISAQSGWVFESAEEGSQPVIVLCEGQPDEEYYWNAVRRHVDLEELTEIPGMRVWGEGSGLVGAVSAISWRGDHDHTWETTVYRKPENIGTTRMLPTDLSEMDVLFPDTFLNRDPRLGKSLLAPRGPCPVLLGIRGESAEQCESAWDWLSEQDGMEPAQYSMTWRTNQACDDHVTKVFSSSVVQRPDIRRRGHCTISTSNHSIISFSEGGELNLLAQSLLPGDVIEYTGLEFEGVIHLERLRLVEPVLRNRMRPLCDCGTRFKSKGQGQSLECPSCGERREQSWVGVEVPHGEWMEPPADRRRHLSAPLSRLMTTRPK